MPSRNEKQRRKALASDWAEAERVADRKRVREQLGDDFGEVSEAVAALFPVYERRPSSLSPLQQAVLDTWVLSGVVGNGGFDAWIRSSGQRAGQTISGLRLLGQHAVADVVAAALAIIANVRGPSRSADAIDALPEADYEHLDRLSERIWDADESLGEAMTRAVRSDDWSAPQ